MFVADVIQVMIASPADVAPERIAFREVLAGWNSLNAKRENCILLPVGWEYELAPKMGNIPQDHINTSLVEKSDLLVAVFWSRIGTPVLGEEGGAISELKKQIEAGKPALLYLCTAPIPQDNLNIAQIEKLRQFKQWAMQNGIIKEFSDTRDFTAKLRDDLTRVLDEDTHLKSLRSVEHQNLETINQVQHEEELINLLRNAAENQTGTLKLSASGKEITITGGEKWRYSCSAPQGWSTGFVSPAVST